MSVLVYLAGKIGVHGWRGKIVKDIDVLTEDIYRTEPSETYIDGLYTTGPFFICCDHGCYHGSESHGVGAYTEKEIDNDSGITPDRCSGEGVPAGLVPQICESQIMDSNFLFAYIDSSTCYGTLYEIGYAKAMGIQVAVMFANPDLKRDMWFISESANIVFSCDGYALKAETRRKEIFSAASQIAKLLV